MSGFFKVFAVSYSKLEGRRTWWSQERERFFSVRQL